MSKRLVVGAVALSVMTGCSAYAADLKVTATPPPAAAPAIIPVPTWSWTGFYIGANAGVGFGDAQWGSPFDIIQNTGPRGPFLSPVAGSLSPVGGLAGGQLGYNYQTGWAVWGLQADWDGVGLTESQDSQPLDFPGSIKDRTNWLASVTGRFGAVVHENTLIYFKGGGAWAGFTHGAVDGSTQAIYPDQSDSRFGWTIGFGAEYHFNPAWSAFIEGDFYDFGVKTVSFPQVTGAFGSIADPFNVDVTERIFAVKAGVNFKFW